MIYISIYVNIQIENNIKYCIFKSILENNLWLTIYDHALLIYFCERVVVFHRLTDGG